MRIARFVHNDTIAYGTVELDEDHGEHPGTIQVLNGDPLVAAVQYTGERLLLDEVRLVAPVIPRSKVVAVGRNYAAHAAEMGNDVPAEPMVFLKPNTAVIGSGEPIIYPQQTNAVDHEAELAVVIGRICKDVPVERVPEVVFGYTCGNDVSARDLQKAALAQDDVFSKRFVYYFAAAWSAFAMAYLVGITFQDIPAGSQRFADTILGVLLIVVLNSVLVMVGIPSTWQRLVVGSFILLAAAFFVTRQRKK